MHKNGLLIKSFMSFYYFICTWNSIIYKMNLCAAFRYSIVNVLYIFNIGHILWKWVLIRNPLPSHLYPTLCQRKW